MLASVHVADVGPRAALSILRKPPDPDAITGLRRADAALAAPLRGSIRPAPSLGRIGLVAFWDDDDALDGFLADDPTAAKLARGWQVRLEPLRAFGSWPGLPDDLPTGRATEYDGPAAVLTLGRLRLSQAIRFLRTSAKAETSVVNAPGLTWATGLGRPPFVATCSLWQTTPALSTYAYGHGDSAHPDAVTANAAKPFHHQSAFIRFRPYGSQGHLDGRNPLAESWMSTPRARLACLPGARPSTDVGSRRSGAMRMVVEQCRQCGFDGADWSDVDAIAVIAGLPARCAAAIDGLHDSDLRRRPIADSWSIAEYVDHVRETTFGMRFMLAIALEAPGSDLGEPPVSRFDPEPRAVDVEAALDGLRAQAEQLHDQLEHLPAPAWASTVVVGGETVDVRWIARHAVHDATHHLTDIERLRGLL